MSEMVAFLLFKLDGIKYWTEPSLKVLHCSSLCASDPKRPLSAYCNVVLHSIHVPNEPFSLNFPVNTLAINTTDTSKTPHGPNITINKSRKRQEIIFLRDDFAHKRNREGETVANIEKHGKSLSAEGKVFHGKPNPSNLEDISEYQESELKEQTVSKAKGPPEIQENEKKSDAYEVVSDTGDNDHAMHAPFSRGDGMVRIAKVSRHRGRHTFRIHANDGLGRIHSHHRSGLHVVSLDGDDTSENELNDKDTQLYGSIGWPLSSSSPRTPRLHFRPLKRGSYYRNAVNDYPPNVISISQDALNGGLSRADEGQMRDEMFPIFRRRDPLSLAQSSQLIQPEELMQPFRPLNPKSVSVGGRPDTFLFPLFNGRSDYEPALVPMTAQNSFPVSSPIEYSSPQPTVPLTNQLLLQPAVQVPALQTQTVNPTYVMPSQMEGQFLLGNQQPDARSLYQLQSQQQLEVPQVPISPMTEKQPIIVPAQMQMSPELATGGQRVTEPASNWVDEDGRQRSEVLDRQRNRQNEERLHDERGEEEEDEDDDDGRHEGSRYYDRDDDSQREDDTQEDDEPPPYPLERGYSRGDEEPSDEENEDAEEPEQERSDDDINSSYDRNDSATEGEESPDSRSTNDNGNDDQDASPSQDNFDPQRFPQQFQASKPQLMQSFNAANRPFYYPNVPGLPNQIDAQTFSRYQLTSPFSALKDHILPQPQQPTSHPKIVGNPNFQISEMTSSEAEFLENKATLEPNFTPPIASKDTIPRKSQKFRFGLRNVLIRLNGKPLEDSSQLRSKIINGQIIQGKGKLIKSKGPVRVKLSHTKDAKHLKIIDIIAPKQFHVYDTKSKIGRPANASFVGTKTSTKKKGPFFANRLQNASNNVT